MIDAERTALGLERNTASLTGARYANTVTLIRALGGGWNSAELPAMASEGEIEPAKAAAR